MNVERKTIIVFEYNEVINEFRELELVKHINLFELLDSDKILLFVDPTRDRVWHWRGSNTTPRMQSLARKSVVAGIRDSYLLKRFPNYDNADIREKFIIVSSVTSIIDEGNEPLDFKILAGLMKEGDYPEFKVNFPIIHFFQGSQA